MPTPPAQRPLAPDDTLYFLHIPKTAGTSFRTLLEDHFDQHLVCPHLNLEDILGRPPSELSAYRLICGHHGWFLHSLVRGTPVLVTLLRDPVERSLSHFYHQRNRPDVWLHELVRDWTFEQYVTSPIGMSELANFQTRHLALDRIQEDYWDHSSLRDRDVDALLMKYADPRLLDRAIERLERCAVVGLVERFEETLALTSYVFQWTPRSLIPRLNARQSRRDPGDLTDRALEAVRRLTALDRALYDHAAARFDAWVKSLDTEAVQRAYADAMARRPRLSAVRYGFERAILGEGWHSRSSRGEEPVTRWTGPEPHATLDLPLADHRDLRITFNAGVYLAELRPSIALAVNDDPIPLSSWQTRYGMLNEGVFTGVIPRAAIAKNAAYARLRFSVARTVRPADLDPKSTDLRRVGIHFRWIEIDPA